MKAVSGNTWVQKAVFFEPKPLFSSALTMWRRGWYLCMELSIIWMGGKEKMIPTQPSFFQQMLVVGQTLLRLNPYGRDSVVFQISLFLLMIKIQHLWSDQSDEC